MKSKTEMSSSKNLSKIGLQDLISKKCKQDHFSYRRYFPIKKNLSSHLPIVQDKDIYLKQLAENKKIENFRINIASSSIDPNLQRVRLTYHTKSTVNMTPKVKLPLLKIGSMYKQNFRPTENQKLVKGKQQDGFFLKLPWHDNPVSNYQKSYHNSDRQTQQLNEKGKAVEGQIKILERKFRGQSSYDQFHSELRKSTQVDPKDCIKDKDHCKGVQCLMKVQSQYKRQYEKSGNKQNIVSSKHIKAANKKQQYLPKINLKNLNPKSSKTILKLKISPPPQLRQILKSTSTHLNL